MRFLTVGLFVLLAAISGRAAQGHATNSPAEADVKKFQLAPGLKLEVVATEPLLQNPVAFSIDAQGRFFVVETHRYRKSIFDITENTPWLLDDLSFRTVNDREAFLRRTFATNLSLLTEHSELVRLVEDRDGDGRAETSSVFAEGFNEITAGTAAGVLAHGSIVWVASIPGITIYDLRFTNGAAGGSAARNAGALGHRQSQIVNGLGVHISVSGHDVHGLILGPDRRLYFSFGDRGVRITNREGAVLHVPDTGGVLRCEPDGRNLEIFCVGLRNPQELAFDDYGNLWTVDNDTAGADPCRVLHLVEGGDYGWRASYQHMKGFGPWVQEELWRGGLDGVLPPAGTVSQGPAGLAFFPGTSATPTLAGKFIHADFPGGVWAYDVKPRGASFELASKEKILWNCWPTDVEFGPDGALYVLDWVQGWAPPGRGRIYRLTATNGVNTSAVAEVQRLLRDGMYGRGEKELLQLLGHADRRVRLEAQWELAARDVASLDGLVATIESSKNRFARLHALWAIAQISRQHPLTATPEDLLDTFFQLLAFLDDPDSVIATRTAQALADASYLEFAVALRPHLESTSPAVRAAALTAYGSLPWGRAVRTHRTAVQKLASKINKPLGWKALRRLEAGRANRNIPGADELAATLHEGASDPFMGHAVARAVGVGIPFGAFKSSLDLLATNSNFNARLTSLHARRQILRWWEERPVQPGYPHLPTFMPAFENGFAEFLFDSEPRVVLEAARAINDAPVTHAYPTLAALLHDSRFTSRAWGWSALSNITPAGPFSATVRPPRDQVLLRAMNAHFRLGEQTNVEELVRFSMRTDADVRAPGLRAEALFLLGAWEVLPTKVGDLPIKPTRDPNHGSTPTVNPENWPGWFDRIVGLWRPLPPRSDEHARRALAPHIRELIHDREIDVARAAIEATVKLRLTNAAPALLGLLESKASASLRQRVPEALAALNSTELSRAVELALGDPDLNVRATALPYLERLSGERATEVLGRIVERTPTSPAEVRLAQAAFSALGKVPLPGAEKILQSALTNLLAGKVPAALELDVLEAAAKRQSATLTPLLTTHTNRLGMTDILARWRSLLQGGDAARGRTIFFEKAEVQCARCHQLKNEGGTVGPALDGIGRRQTREQLLEGIVLPNRQIAAGFENVTVTLKNGTDVAGLIKSESETELRLDSPEDGLLTLPKANISTRHRGLSAMPEGLGALLTPRELRDLVEFLAATR